MLFTSSTEAGVKLENALLLTPELIKKAQIPANKSRLSEWARDNHINICFNFEGQSDFNCRLGIMMDSQVSDNTYSANKKMLKHAGDEFVKFLESLPSNADDAADEAIVINEVNKIFNEFVEKINKIDNKLIVQIHIIKLKGHE